MPLAAPAVAPQRHVQRRREEKRCHRIVPDLGVIAPVPIGDHVTTVFLAGDVMTGRGIDQIMRCPSPPEIHESYVRDARDYVRLAEEANGPVPRPVEPAYIWGDALDELARVQPAARIVNLETAVTRSDFWWKGKGINYRMHPANVTCLTAARIDVCALANNHVLDYDDPGLEETLETLGTAGLKTAGAGRTLPEAQRPAIVDLAGGYRVVVFSCGTETSGIPPAWAAAGRRAGVDFLHDVSDATASAVVDRVRRVKRPGDVVVVSIHWGGNWGYAVPEAHVRFAHRLVDGGVDIVHGHSSHHPRPIEVYRDRLVLYGCGNFIDDYEGISGYEEFRDDLALMYFPAVDASTGRLTALRMTPMHIRRMRLNRASPGDAEWLRRTLDRISRDFGSEVELGADGCLAVGSVSRRS
ncbi:MAG: CapA family protein [Candidatus Rokubacteria bacterium]|nr:CapA family protein [Candidatus Rokubacteria bacterium]